MSALSEAGRGIGRAALTEPFHRWFLMTPAPARRRACGLRQGARPEPVQSPFEPILAGRQAASPVCALQPIPIRVFAPYGQTLS